MALLTKSAVIVMISTFDYEFIGPEMAIMVDISHWRVHENRGIFFLFNVLFPLY